MTDLVSGLPIAVVGAGIGGLTLASALERVGCDVVVLEQHREMGEVGAGISLWPSALAALDAVRCRTRWRSCPLSIRRTSRRLTPTFAGLPTCSNRRSEGKDEPRELVQALRVLKVGLHLALLNNRKVGSKVAGCQ